jgi:hypothetical protein
MTADFESDFHREVLLQVLVQQTPAQKWPYHSREN